MDAINSFFESIHTTWLGLGYEVQLVLWSLILFATVAGVGQVAVVFMVLMERKVLAWLTQRKGPNRVGPWGVLQTVADGVKLLFKEDIMTHGQDKLLFTLGPVLFFLPVFVLYAFVPFSDALYGFVGLNGAAVAEAGAKIGLPAGVLMFFALSSLSVLGIVISGWASNNKYSLLGGMRSAAQAISYEIPLVLSVLGVVIMTGTLDVVQIVEAQSGPFWTWFWFAITPISFFVFFISAIAEVNRIPFDLPEAESELVSGYNTEYSGMKFAMFFLAEYAALFIMSAMTVALFFGGYHSPLGTTLVEMTGIFQSVNASAPALAQMLMNGEQITWMLLKTYAFIFIAMWIRGTLPRLKPDQLMGFSWKFLIPLSLVNILVVSFERLWVIQGQQMDGYLLLWLGVLGVGLAWFVRFMSNTFSRQISSRLNKTRLA